MRAVTFSLLFASVALGQSLTFQLKNTSGQGLQEIATTMRSVFDVKTLSVDPAVSTITITGTPDQIAASEWLIPKLDALPGTLPTPQKYLFGGSNNDVVEIFALKNAPALTDVQEIVTGLRTVADIAKIYQLTAPRLLILRADADHMALADFLTPQLDQAASVRTNATVQTYQMAGGGNYDSVLVYGLAHAGTLSINRRF